MDYLLDSNVLIDYLAFRIKGETLLRINSIVNKGLYISVITKIEVLGFVSDVEGLDTKTRQFIDLAKIYDLTPDVVNMTIELRKKLRIKLPDAIIAATAITRGFILLSGNTKDFTGIKGLEVKDPYSL